MRKRDFSEELAVLTSAELGKDAEAIGTVIERLANSLGLAIAVSCNGDTARADEMIQGVESYLLECVATHSKLARFMNDIRRYKGTRP